MIDKSVIDPNALQFYRMLKEAGFSAYFVGGSVRDLLLGKSPKDFDIATNATPQQIKRVIPQGRIIGRRFRHVMLERHGGRYEIVTFRGPVVEAEQAEQAELDDEAIEDQPTSEAAIAEAAVGEQRSEGGARDDRGPRRNYPDLNQFGNAEQDAKRRDFTINALFYDPDADELVDYVEGKLDIDRKLIRSIGESQQRMEEDPIRILRAIRHKMKLGLEYDSALEAAMREKAPLLETTSKDRIREEFLKVCNDHSLGAFLSESRRLGLVPHIMPWFEGISEESWEKGMRLWEQLKSFPIPERPSPDLGLALMMVPLISPLVLEPYKATLSEEQKNYLPDMKYFLSCETLRNYYLRNLRISRAQTDHIVRTLFYYSRMSGLWLEQGPPRRIVGRLFQHPPALLAAKMAKIFLDLEGRETPPWILELAEYDPSRRRDRGDRGHRDSRDGREHGGRDRDHHHRDERDDRDEGHDSQDEGGMSADGGAPEGASSEEGGEQPRERSERGERRPPRAEGAERNSREGAERNSREGADRYSREEPREARVNRLPPPDQPMVWNGPLHAPVLRPNFAEEPVVRWARKNQTVRAYRPSGIPNQPLDHALLKSDLVYNYKPEIEAGGSRPQEEAGGDRGDRGARRRGRRGRGRNREDRGPREENAELQGQENEEVPSSAEGAQDAMAGDEQEGQPQSHAERESDQEHRGNRGRHSGNGRGYDDEDSIGNTRAPGEAPAALADLDQQQGDDDYDDEDDNIGNRLDAPPTSGHVGINGEGVLAPQRSGQGRGGSGGSRGGGGGGGGGGRRRGRRRGRRGGGGGQNRGSQPRHPQ